MTLPELIDLAVHGKDTNTSTPSPCFYCGGSCYGEYPVTEHVKGSFNNRGDVVRPGALYVCRGCVWCLRDEGEVEYPGGERRLMTKAVMRMHSFAVTRSQVIAANKSHLSHLRAWCVIPPEPPFGISLAVSGQKHVLFRGVVNHVTDQVTVTLEGERVTYRPSELAERLRLCGHIVAATGKPALATAPTSGMWWATQKSYRDWERMCSEWERVWEEPLSRLAAFLCPNKEDCLREYPNDRS